MASDEQLAELERLEGVAAEQLFLELMIEHHRGWSTSRDQQHGGHAGRADVATARDRSATGQQVHRPVQCPRRAPRSLFAFIDGMGQSHSQV